MKENSLHKESENIALGTWLMNPATGLIKSENEKELYLEPRLSHLFMILFKNANVLVSRKRIIDDVWHDTVVNEESLTRAVSDLRRILKKNFKNPPVIETIHKRGYKMHLEIGNVKKPFLKTALRYIIYFILIFTIIILVIRGINY